jgi:multimeric flavodoxin WrbA
MSVLGISASGRANGITGEAVKAVLEATGEPYEYVSLSGLRIGGCIGCTQCAADNRCQVKDDWNEIGEKMLAAEAIVFGAPNYYGTINALGHACLERTFCFRHREVFRLAGKLGVAVGVDGGEQTPVLDYICKMMRSNMMSVVGRVYAAGYSQCYTCGFGHDCVVGGVVGRHGILECIEAEHLPPRLEEQETARFRAYGAGKVLGNILRARMEG